MKKSIMSKITILALLFMLVACACTSVFAADNIPSLNDELNINNTPSGNEGNTQKPSNNTENTTGDVLGNTTGNNTENTLGNTAENSATNSFGNSIGNNTNSNSSSYKESDTPLSNAGLESYVLMVSAFIVCAVIGIYTFMKLSDYSNI